MLLSNRMQAVVGLVVPCASIADIGCDHGYVAIELISRCICQYVFAMDIHLGPLERAKHNIKEYRMQEYIETRQSNGMESLSKGEAEGVICAGMGGRLMISILERGQALVHDMQQVVLQPQSEIDEVRAYLRKNGFIIEKEDIICEDGKYYPMMRALPNTLDRQEKQIAENLTRIKDMYGSYLLEKSHPTLKRYLLWQKEHTQQILENLISQSQPTPRQQQRIDELNQKLGDIVYCLYHYF